MTVRDWKNWLNDRPQQDQFNLIQTRKNADHESRLRATQDSRQLPLTAAHETLFIAIRGVWHDGHDYLAAAHGMGARYFWSNPKPPSRRCPIPMCSSQQIQCTPGKILLGTGEPCATFLPSESQAVTAKQRSRNG